MPSRQLDRRSHESRGTYSLPWSDRRKALRSPSSCSERERGGSQPRAHPPPERKAGDLPAFAPEEVSIWSSQLGNHCLLKKSQNESIGNKAWAIKKPILAKSELQLTKSVAKEVDWTQKEIAARQKELAKLAAATWPRDP